MMVGTLAEEDLVETGEKREITCAGCGLVFEPGWSYEEAVREAIKNGIDPHHENAIEVCDYCYQAAVKRYPWLLGAHNTDSAQ